MNHSQDSTPRPLLQIVIRMDERLGVHVAHNCPSGDVVEMLLYRALKYAERELTAGRLFKVEEPQVTIEKSLPKDLGHTS
mgnify:FL=1